MKSEPKIQLEAYLQELVLNRPSSKLKLIAAWDGLTIETQIKILNVVRDIPHKLKLKALCSPNAYIRYLVADRFCSFRQKSNFALSKENSEENALFQKIATDENIIVKFSQCPSQKIYEVGENEQGHKASILRPKNFFALSREEQIMYFSGLSIRDGDVIAKIIEWGMEYKALAEEHLNDLIIECSSNFEKYKPIAYDYDYSGAKGFKALWKLVSKLGLRKSAKWLIWSLSEVDHCDEIPEDALRLLDQELLIEVLNQTTVYLREIRKKIVYSTNEYAKEVRIAAASIHLDLSNDDITNLFRDKNYDVINIIIESAGDGEYGYFYGLSPVYIHALIDARDSELRKYNNGSYHYGFERYFNAHVKHSSENEKKYFIKNEICKLAIYFLARGLVPWKSCNQIKTNYMHNCIPKELSFLKNRIIKNNTWETYKVFLHDLSPIDSYSEFLLSYVSSRKLSPDVQIVASPDELFGEQGREGIFIDEKIDYLYKQIKKISNLFMNRK